MIENIFRQRFHLYHKRLLKLMKLVLNDHLIIIFFLMIGSGSFIYRDLIDQLAEHRFIGIALVILVFYLSTQAGSLTILFKYADQVYLLPQENELKKTLKISFWRSFLIQSMLVLFIYGLMYPLIQKLYLFSSFKLFTVVILLLCLKLFHIWGQLLNIFHLPKVKYATIFSSVLAIISLAGAFLVDLIVFTVISLLTAVLVCLLTKKWLIKENIRINWDQAISSEENRLNRLYLFISLFTDIPGFKNQVDKSLWIRQWIQAMDRRNSSPVYFYLIRVFTRNRQNRRLFLRLTFFGGAIIYLCANLYLSIFLSLLFIFMTAYQLLPLIQHAQRQLFFNIYPIKEDSFIKALKKLTYLLITMQIFIFQVILLIKFQWIGLIAGGLMILMIVLFNECYLPHLKRKKEKK